MTITDERGELEAIGEEEPFGVSVKGPYKKWAYRGKVALTHSIAVHSQNEYK